MKKRICTVLLTLTMILSVSVTVLGEPETGAGPPPPLCPPTRAFTLPCSLPDYDCE